MLMLKQRNLHYSIYSFEIAFENRVAEYYEKLLLKKSISHKYLSRERKLVIFLCYIS